MFIWRVKKIYFLDEKKAFTVATGFLPQNDPFQKNCAIGCFDLDFNSLVNDIKVILSRSVYL